MNYKLDKILLCILWATCCMNCSKTSLSDGFIHPPDDTKPGIYWYWIDENISKEGLTKDLEALEKMGIGEVFIGNVCISENLGEVETLSPEWVECMQHAIREGSRIGINVGIFNGPGWSQSGGPWVKPEDAMRYLVYSEVNVSGPSKIKQYIGKPKEFFQDVVVLAYPETPEETQQKPVLSSKPNATGLSNLTDSDENTLTAFNNKRREDIQIDIQYRQPETKRSLYIKPGDQAFHVYCEVYIKRNNEYVLVKSR